MMQLRSLLGRPIVVHRSLIDLVDGNIAYALFLGQLIYWNDNPQAQERDGWFYKTQAEWYEETSLRRTQQENARKFLVDRGLLEERLEGLPAKLWYRLNVDALEATLLDMVTPKFAGDLHTDSTPPANSNVRDLQTYRTEDYVQENTTVEEPTHTPHAPASASDILLAIRKADPTIRWALFGKKPANARGSKAPDKVIATEAALEWAQSKGWTEAGILEDVQLSAEAALEYYRGTGKRHDNWEAAIDTWIRKDILNGVDEQRLRKRAHGQGANVQRGETNGPRGNGTTGAGRQQYGYNADGQPTNKATAVQSAAINLDARQRARRMARQAGSDAAQFGPDDGGSG